MDGQHVYKCSYTNNLKSLSILVISITLLALILSGCMGKQATQATLSNSTSTPRSQQMAITPSWTLSPAVILNTPSGINHPVWGMYAGPKINPPTEIPPVMAVLDVPDEVLVWVLLGMDSEAPFSGLTPSIHLLFINPRLAKASLVSIPGSLYVYIPGYTMQRISTAYSIGGMALLKQTLAYNLGVQVDRFVLAHPEEFQWLVDDAGGIEVSVLYPLPKACSGLAAGPQGMNGEKALCYATYLSGNDEVDRMQRQQQLLRLLFLKFASGGNLSKLPLLYASYKDWISTDLALDELLGYVPLALKLADSERIKYFIIGWQAIEIWQLPGNTQAQVFLPDRQAVSDIMKNAVDVVMVPSPLSDFVSTLEYELTAVAITPGVSQTPAATDGSITPSVVTPTPTATPVNQPTTPLYP